MEKTKSDHFSFSAPLYKELMALAKKVEKDLGITINFMGIDEQVKLYLNNYFFSIRCKKKNPKFVIDFF